MPALPVAPQNVIGGFFGVEPAGTGGMADLWGAPNVTQRLTSLPTPPEFSLLLV
jgi:hypothetical protein